MIYIFDGTYAGFLTAVFESFEFKQFNITPVTAVLHSNSLFEEETQIITDEDKFLRVKSGLEKRIGKNRATDFYRAFLSEDPKIWKISFRLIVEIFKGNTSILENFGDQDVLLFHQTLRKISRERHRMKAFVRFNKTSDGMFFALIEPDFNVLPLILPFFKNRYTDQSWLIYDVKRKYGCHYDTINIHEVVLDDFDQNKMQTSSIGIALDERDELFENLWKHYFKSTNIEVRKNLKLHLQHVPKRYWKYLPEKK